MLSLLCLALLCISNVCFSVEEKDTDVRFALLEDKIKGLHIYFDAEIRSFRRTLRQEVAIRRTIEDRLANSDQCVTATEDGDKLKNGEISEKEEDVLNSQGQRVQSKCINEFRNVSRRIDVLDSQLEGLSDCMKGENKIPSTCSAMEAIEKEISQQTEATLELKDDLSALEVEVSKLRLLHQNESEEVTDPSACLEQNVYRGFRSDRHFLTKPFFVSEWTMMKSQDNELSEIFITHGLGQHPLKVDVQVRPTSGPNAGWIFPGTGSPQSDDDQNVPHGGVVYIYNETTVKLIVPRKHNNYASGSILYTGERNSEWLGDHHQTASSAYVRVRVWGPQSLPNPEFKTEWMPLNIGDASTSYRSIPHHLGRIPSLVSMQVLIGNTNWISEGIGSTMTPASISYKQTGGIIHAFDKSTIRIWLPYFTQAGIKLDTGRVFTNFDGWGKTHFPNNIITYGKVRAMAWGKSIDVQRQEITEVQSSLHAKDIEANLESDMLWMSVKASEGVNKDFQFPVYGSVQNILTPFGGLVCAYKANGDIRTWRPNPAKNGFIINVRKPFGNGAMVQASNHASLVVSWLKPSC